MKEKCWKKNFFKEVGTSTNNYIRINKMETLILHFGTFIAGVSLSCLLFMAFFMPVYLRITSKNKE